MTVKCNKLRRADQCLERSVQRVLNITAGQPTEKASYWLFRSVISHLLADL